tara:strand:+ start:2152 stop:2394 length:243 start_codon:yes stop_codon:yes gene_type:complete
MNTATHNRKPLSLAYRSSIIAMIAMIVVRDSLPWKQRGRQPEAEPGVCGGSGVRLVSPEVIPHTMVDVRTITSTAGDTYR